MLLQQALAVQYQAVYGQKQHAHALVTMQQLQPNQMLKQHVHQRAQLNFMDDLQLLTLKLSLTWLEE